VNKSSPFIHNSTPVPANDTDITGLYDRWSDLSKNFVFLIWIPIATSTVCVITCSACSWLSSSKFHIQVIHPLLVFRIHSVNQSDQHNFDSWLRISFNIIFKIKNIKFHFHSKLTNYSVIWFYLCQFQYRRVSVVFGLDQLDFDFA